MISEKDFTSAEWKIISLLQSKKGEIVSHADLWAKAESAKVLLVHIRQKLTAMSATFHIETIRGKGYRLVDGPATVEPDLPKCSPRKYAVAA